jgi:hypothetical protein
MASTVQQAGSLFGVALRAADSITADEHAGHQQSALVSLVFSVVSLEAFLNETVELANMALYLGYSEPEVVPAFIQLMTDAEKSRASLESKFILANWLLTGKSLDRGVPPYQDLALLLKVRNQLVHFKPNEIFTDVELTPETFSKSRNSAVEQLRSRNVLATNIVGLTGWTAWIETKAMAKWSCGVVSRMVVDFVGKAPAEGQWSLTLRFMQRAFTQEVQTGKVSTTFASPAVPAEPKAADK